MIDPLFIFVLEVLVVVGGLMFLVGYARKAIVSHTVTVTREIDADERLISNVNFTIFDSQATREKKLQEMYVLGEIRRAVRFKQFQDIVAAEQEKKQLKPVS